MREVRDYFSTGEKEKQGYSKLVTLLGYRHQRDSRHDKFVKEALELIVKQLAKSLTPGESCVFCELMMVMRRTV